MELVNIRGENVQLSNRRHFPWALNSQRALALAQAKQALARAVHVASMANINHLPSRLCLQENNRRNCPVLRSAAKAMFSRTTVNLFFGTAWRRTRNSGPPYLVVVLRPINLCRYRAD